MWRHKTFTAVQNIWPFPCFKGSRLIGRKEERVGTDRERGVEGEFVERPWRSGDLVEAYPLVGDLVDT